MVEKFKTMFRKDINLLQVLVLQVYFSLCFDERNLEMMHNVHLDRHLFHILQLIDDNKTQYLYEQAVEDLLAYVKNITNIKISALILYRLSTVWILEALLNIFNLYKPINKIKLSWRKLTHLTTLLYLINHFEFPLEIWNFHPFCSCLE